jgi:hypothetical protein
MHAHQATPSRNPGWITKQVAGTGIAAIAAAMMSTYDPLATQESSTNHAIGKSSYSIDLGSKLVPAISAVSKNWASKEAQIERTDDVRRKRLTLAAS